jgi:phosphohistidine swiveling domain-containing protein
MNNIYIDFFISHCKHICGELFDLGNQLVLRNFEGEPSSTLLTEFMNFTSKTIRVIPFLTTLALIQKNIESQLNESLSRVFNLSADSEELKTIIKDLMLKDEKTTHVTQSIKDIKALIDYTKENAPLVYQGLKDRLEGKNKDLLSMITSELSSKLDEYLAQYDFLSTDYYMGTPTTINQLLDQMSVFTCNKERQDSQDTPTLTYDESLLGKPENELLERVRNMHFIRQHRIEALFKSGRQSRGLLTEIGQRLGLTYDETIHLTYTEIVDSLMTAKLAIDFSVISDRMVEYGLIMENRVTKYIMGEELVAAKQRLPIKVESSNRLSGETAYSGKCKGTAYVIDDLENIEGMRQGDILVAPMTSPYHVSAMMIADAVLTNEGGILSHAAIICRELKIPCIVGLKNATAIIKSGDRLNINAESSVGIVEISESSS